MSTPLRADPVPQFAAPPVGFLRVVVASNGYSMVSLPFEPFDPGVNAVLLNQMTDGATTSSADLLSIWLSDVQTDANAWRMGGYWMDGAPGTPALSDLELHAGGGFWLHNRHPFDQQVFLSGTVPLDSPAVTPLLPGLNLVGYPFASSAPVNLSSFLASGAWAPDESNGDALWRWNNALSGYDPMYDLWGAGEYWPAGWYGPYDWDVPTTDRLRLGEGFWYVRATSQDAFDWSEDRPYDDLFGPATALPRVTAISISRVVPSATLSILLEDGANRPVDVLTLDADAEGAFATEGWSHAARLPTRGFGGIAWTDTPGHGRAPVTDVHARFYLVARADLDADGDGLSDALETHVYGTDATDPDTDDDGLPDGWEQPRNLDPLDPESGGVSVWTWGGNWSGQLGDGTATDRLSPVRVGTEVGWRAVSAGIDHTVAVGADGRLWAWGSNYSGQLGDGTTTDSLDPVSVGTAANWSVLAPACEHTAALRSDGSLWAWGGNGYGQLGDGTQTSRLTPTRIGTGTDWASVSSMAYHSVALKSDGSLWAWGYNWYGQIGDGTATDRHAPVRIGTASDWVWAVAGAYHSLAIKANGTLWAWGDNSSGQLGDGTYDAQSAPVQVGTSANWRRVGAGEWHSVGLAADGTLWAWGDNYFGELGNNTDDSSAEPVPVNGGAVWSQVCVGGAHTLARKKADGTLWAWGDNTSGQLGDGTRALRRVPTAIGGAVSDWVQLRAGYQHSAVLRGAAMLEVTPRARFHSMGATVGQTFAVRSTFDWSARADVPWITVAAGGTGAGDGVVGYALQNGLGSRTGTITVTGGGQSATFRVMQGIGAGDDEDSDGIPDAWEEANGLDPEAPDDALLDYDGDGLSNLEEYVFGGDPYNADTDGDGLTDAEEVDECGTDPHDSDTDGDGFGDAEELTGGTDPLDPDSHLDYNDATHLRVQATVQDLWLDDDGWELYAEYNNDGQKHFLMDNLDDVTAITTNWVRIAYGDTVRFTIKRVEVDQSHGTDEYKVSFTPQGGAWLPDTSPTNSSLEAVVSYNGNEPPDVSGLKWGFTPIKVEIDEIKGLYTSNGTYQIGYTSTDDVGRVYCNSAYDPSNPSGNSWSKNKQYVDFTVKVTPANAVLPSDARIVWEADDPDDPSNEGADVNNLAKGVLDPNDYDSADNDGDGTADNSDGNDNTGGLDGASEWEAISADYALSGNETKIKDGISKVRFNVTDDGGDNFIVKVKLRLNPGTPPCDGDQTGVMTVWKKINIESVTMSTADALPVNGLPARFTKAFVEFHVALSRSVSDGVVNNGTPPVHQWVMGLTKSAAFVACQDYVTAATGEFSQEGPGWFFVASAHEFHPLASLTSEVLYPPSGTASNATANGTTITLPIAIATGKVPEVVYLYNASLSSNVLFVIKSGSLSADRKTFEIETKDYHRADSPYTSFLDADLKDYGFATGSTVNVRVKSPGSYGIGGISPGLAGKTIVFTGWVSAPNSLGTLVHELTHAFGLAHKCGNWDFTATTPSASCAMNYGTWFILDDGTPRAPVPWTDERTAPNLCAAHIKKIRESNLEDLPGLGW